jgi:hypothetical protein
LVLTVGACPRDVRPSSETEVRSRVVGVSAWQAMGAVGPQQVVGFICALAGC